jgi:lysozyme family protein
MNSNFQRSLAAVLKDEGGNDDDPQDHGGRTSRGITQREYTAWLAEYKRPNADVWQAPQADIDQIYYDGYWMPECNTFPLGVDFQFFSMKVNAGPHRAICILQQAMGINDDGRIGPVTRQVMLKIPPMNIIQNFYDRSRYFYTGLHQPKFLKGWLNRAIADRALALLMAEGK